MDAADLALWSPVRLLVEAPEPVVDWCDLSMVRFTEPFFAMTVDRVLQASPETPIVRTTLSALASVEATAPGRNPAGFIFHVSRCGSTLVSRTSAMLPDIAVVSEPDPLNALLELDPSTIREDVLIDCVRLLVRAWCRSRSEVCVLFKLSSWNLRLASVIERAFPAVPRALVYREPTAITASLIGGPPGWMKVRHTRPEQLAWLFGIVSAERLNDSVFAVAAVKSFLEAAMALDERAPLLLVNYSELPMATWSRVLPLFGRHVDPPEVATLEAASRWNAKAPDRPFVPDEIDKRAMISMDAAQEVAYHLDPLYTELEARRAFRQRM